MCLSPARPGHGITLCAALLLSLTAGSTGHAQITALESEHLKVTIEPSGAYQIVAAVPGWTLAGKLPSPATGIKKDTGTDAAGKYQQVTFAWKDNERDLTGSIRLDEAGDAILFADTLTQAEEKPASPFPDFTTIPQGWLHMAYENRDFSPPQFSLHTTSSPWLFFDAQDHALIISAASHFPIVTLTGDGATRVASSFTPTLKNLPAGFTRQTLLAFGEGINATYDLWGHVLTGLEGKKKITNDGDLLLKYYGYWTDAGAAYWYNYDLNKGYQGTLQQIVDTYRQEKIPLRYLQLDSWWYHKTLTWYDGKPLQPKNNKLPEGDWNRYGGTLEYAASPAVFPQGMASFHEATGLPFITHNRWIDPASPYHERYKISGVAAVDPAFWKELAAYMKASGIVTYEQDWLSAIFPHSPELSSTPDLGEAFLDGMANACRDQNITVQYCMPPPQCILQASKYDNVTTIRASGDRFARDRYHWFLYTSRFVTAIGSWPWCDVFMSGETNNMLISNLSAGPVGTGDAIGKENRENIFKTIRADGVIIKPDTAVVPVDSAYIAEAQNQTGPLVATAHTDHRQRSTVYALVLDPPKGPQGEPFTLSPAELGTGGPLCVYDYFSATACWLGKDQPYSGKVAPGGLSYLIAVPVGPSGIAFLGDGDKFISMGRQRVASVDDRPDHLTTEILLSAGEEAVTLHGYSHKSPTITVRNGSAAPVEYDAASGHFTVKIQPGAAATLDAGPDPVRHLEVTMRL